MAVRLTRRLADLLESEHQFRPEVLVDGRGGAGAYVHTHLWKDQSTRAHTETHTHTHTLFLPHAHSPTLSPPQVKSRQLKKLFEKYQSKKAEITDLQEQFQREREGLLEDYRILTQQVSVCGQACKVTLCAHAWNGALRMRGVFMYGKCVYSKSSSNVNGGGGGAAGGPLACFGTAGQCVILGPAPLCGL